MTSNMNENKIGSSKVVVVTGASRGIGAATARLAGIMGYAVCVNYLNSASKAKAVADSIITDGGKAIVVQADVGKEDDVMRLFDEVDAAFGRLDALVNNAGITGDSGTVGDIDLERLRDVFTTNVYGAFLCGREALRRMSTDRGGDGGAIVNVSSQVATFGGNRQTHYAASKAAINAFTIGFAREAASVGIRVNGVSPGVIETDPFHEFSEEQKELKLSSIPMGRAGQPEEVAQAILWLLSDSASYVNGVTVPVHGAR